MFLLWLYTMAFDILCKMLETLHRSTLKEDNMEINKTDLMSERAAELFL